LPGLKLFQLLLLQVLGLQLLLPLLLRISRDWTDSVAANGGTKFAPPDTILGKSPTRAIEAANSAIRLFTNTGAALATADLNTFFGAPVADGKLFDPKVFYDRRPGNPRVYAVGLQVSGKGNTNAADNISKLWLAISRSPNPANLTAAWCRYEIDDRDELGAATESWGDYPSIGAGVDSFSVSLNNFTFTNDSFRFALIHVFDKAVAADNATTCPTIPLFTFQPSSTAANFGLFTIQAAQHYTAPASRTGVTNPAYFMNTKRGSSNQYVVHRIKNVASGSPLYERVTLTDTAYGIPPNGTQPGTTKTIDSGDNRVLQVAGIGNTIVGEITTVCNFTGGTPNESCTLTPEVDVSFGAGGALAASMAENVFAGSADGIFVHHPSIAVNPSFEMAANWEINGTGQFMTSAALIKDPGGIWTSVEEYAPGNCPYQLLRAGDYSGAQLDPALTAFWLAGEQAITMGSVCQWATRVVKVTP